MTSRYGKLLAATPPEPKSFTVNFMPASSEVLTEESVQTVAEMQAFLAQRPAPEITVIGHTDRLGVMKTTINCPTPGPKPYAA